MVLLQVADLGDLSVPYEMFSQFHFDGIVGIILGYFTSTSTPGFVPSALDHMTFSLSWLPISFDHMTAGRLGIFRYPVFKRIMGQL